jgi:hypothetical protein
VTIRLVGVGLLAIVAVLGVAGCASPVSRAPQSAAPVATPTPVPTKPSLDQLTIDPDGIGPLRIGQPVPTLLAALSPVTWDASKCYEAGVSPAVGTPGVGAWLPSYPDVAFEGGLDSVFSLYTVGDVQTGNIKSLWSWTSDLKTSKGISVDSSLANLQAAYPHFDAIIPSGAVTVYAVDGSVGQMLFEVATQSTEMDWSTDQLGTVRVIHLQLKTEKPFAVTGSSDGLGFCSQSAGMYGG